MVLIVEAVLAATLLCASCSVMVCAWYLHLKYPNWSWVQAILVSWLIAGGEYILQVPANRIGSSAGMSVAQLRGIAEIAILSAFLLFQVYILKQPLLWNHVFGFTGVLISVLVVLDGPFTGEVPGPFVAPRPAPPNATNATSLYGTIRIPSVPEHDKSTPESSPQCYWSFRGCPAAPASITAPQNTETDSALTANTPRPSASGSSAVDTQSRRGVSSYTRWLRT